MEGLDNYSEIKRKLMLEQEANIRFIEMINKYDGDLPSEKTDCDIELEDSILDQLLIGFFVFANIFGWIFVVALVLVHIIG